VAEKVDAEKRESRKRGREVAKRDGKGVTIISRKQLRFSGGGLGRSRTGGELWGWGA